MSALSPLPLEPSTAGSPVFSNDFISVQETGIEGRVAVTVGTGSGAVALVRRNGKTLMVRHPRYATDSLEWELPRASSLEGEAPLETVQRCVEGWTGVQVDTSSALSLGVIFPDPEIITNKVSIHLVEAMSTLVRVNHENVRWVDTETLVDSCLSGEVEDAFTCTAVLRARIKELI